jgi:pimeloyl-ACP methyl ester carboxylesterase
MQTNTSVASPVVRSRARDGAGQSVSLDKHAVVLTEGRPTNPVVAIRITRLPRASWLPERQWPFQTSLLEANGLSIAVTEVGKGPVLLFVHAGQWSFIWREVMIRLSVDFRCICLDAPGTGQSPRAPRSEITLENASRGVEAVIRGLELENIALIVHDLGGPAGIAAAARTPDRIRGIAAINAFAWMPSGGKFRGMLRVVGSAFVREFDVLTEFVPKLSASAFGLGRHLDEQSRNVFRAGMRQGRIRAFHYYIKDTLNCDSLYAELAKAFADPFRGLPFITIFGERNDPLRFQPRWKELFPDARQVVIAKGNHYPMGDDPDLVANSIRDWHRNSVMPTTPRR